MVDLNPVYSCILAVEEGLQRGDAVQDILHQWLSRKTRGSFRVGNSNEFQQELLTFLRRIEIGENGSPIRSKTHFREYFLTLLTAGANGQGILPRIRELRVEIEKQIDLDIKTHIDALPMKMLVPLLLFLFPAFLILLLGPVTGIFVKTLQ